MRQTLAIVLTLCLVGAAGATPTTVEEAQAEGFAPRPEDEPAGSLFGGLLALGPGLVWHGVGHFYAGDRQTAFGLALAEAAGVAMVVGALILDETTHGSGPAGGARLALTHAGVMLFIGSWAADIIGTFKGGEAFDPLTLRTDGNTIGLAYRFTNNPLTPSDHHLVTRLTLDNGRVWLRPLVDVDAGLGLWQLEIDAGVRVLRGENPQNHIALGLRGRRFAVREFGYTSTAVVAYAGWQADLGQAMRGLRNFYVFSRVGYGLIGYQFGDETGEAPGLSVDPQFIDSWLLLETGVAVNSGRRTTVTVAFIEDPTRDIGLASAELGFLEVGLFHRQSANLDIELAFSVGDGWGIWLGLGYGL